MSLLKTIYKTELAEPKLTELLTKINTYAALNARRFLVEYNHVRYRGDSLTSFEVNPSSATGTILFTNAAIKAANSIQGLHYQADTAGVAGNNISIEYIDTYEVQASKEIQDITYEAVDAGSAGNSISVEYVDTYEVQASKEIQDITYEAVAAGVGGNSITIAYTGGGTAGSEVVSVVGNAISVQIESGVSTATQVKAAIDLSAEAIALVSATISGTAGDAQVTVSATNLENGKSLITAGNEVVSVVGNAISVEIKSGVSTATQIKAKIDAKAEAIALVSATISGTAGDAQIAAVAANLENGHSLITAGNEVVSVASSAITVEIEAGVSTATQIKAAIDAYPAAAALVDVTALSGTDLQAVQAATNLFGGLALVDVSIDKANIIKIRRLRTKKYLVIAEA